MPSCPLLYFWPINPSCDLHRPPSQSFRVATTDEDPKRFCYQVLEYGPDSLSAKYSSAYGLRDPLYVDSRTVSDPHPSWQHETTRRRPLELWEELSFLHEPPRPEPAVPLRVNNPTLGEFCFAMIGRADIEGSKSDVALNAWPPQASYPCGNFSDRRSTKTQSPIIPVLRANPYPEVTDPICRLPLPTLFYRPEAVHLGDLLRI
ncbi:unnamed protein product [Lepeophtheirus salmonis]|uniref:(salmon louse) hypothetical protein n=1 Tax=Lepeophtheirus salmonis TaxID=72036 RepID=A0A7R8D5P8_LEPSM|nr:unnamed protein product [Lepeophtheirus salmonis]CAF3037588.1 unnamed protein product [Lepeophtheirus salmonis]